MRKREMGTSEEMVLHQKFISDGNGKIQEDNSKYDDLQRRVETFEGSKMKLSVGKRQILLLCFACFEL